MFSINTNAGALTALQKLTSTGKELKALQGEVNTGLKVSSSKDDAATYAISQKLKGELAGLKAAQTSLDRAQSTLDVALAAAEAVSDLLIEMKQKAVAAADGAATTIDRSALNNDFVQLREQVKSIVENAEFNGTNIVKSGGDNIVAITDSSGDATITVAAQSLAFGSPGPGPNITLDEDDTILLPSDADFNKRQLEESIVNVNGVLSEFGAATKRLALQKSFTNRLMNNIEVGVGNLIDADMAKASAELQTLQVRQQLGLQALSIANQAPNTVLSLFR